ncbi:MAG: polysaccharide deacetylase family protein [Spirochaetales bacterium]|jgi:peptidoglycan/xylan/chitin deacetylase (PgdA/CDA1 family)|nr:polysaccharide deacetylase family protein [Spirochaetales bacterium]
MALKKLCALFLFLVWGLTALSGEVTFENLTLSKRNKLLFQALAEGRGHPAYKTLFMADLESGKKKPLTFFPEDLSFLSGTGGLQIQNRFGVFRTDKDFSHVAPLEKFPSFLTGTEVRNGKLPYVRTSPDGRFILYIAETSPAYGELILFDSYLSQIHSVSSKFDMSLEGPKAAWSPDSRFFVYEKERGLYYFSIEYLFAGKLLAENFRRLGDGGISSVNWDKNGDFYLVSGSLVYKIKQTEIFTRVLYQTLITQGEIVGKIPFAFDPNFDRFWISPDGGHMILCVDGRNIFLYTLLMDDYLGGESLALPYLYLPRTTHLDTLIWGKNNIATLMTVKMEKGERKTEIYRLDLVKKANLFDKTSDTDIRRIILSPDETYAALLKKDSVEIRDYTLWKSHNSFSYDEPLDAVWAGENLIVGGTKFIQSVSASTGESRFICFSQPGEFGFQGENVLVKTGDAIKLFNPATDEWTSVEEFSPEPVSTATTEFRVFPDLLPSGTMKNTIMVRNLAAPKTTALFFTPRTLYDHLDAQTPERVDMTNFTHGSRTHRREVSFVFNAIDSVEGLGHILETLADYNIRATFFINGDFIRRNPEAVKEIAASGHEVGSLFFTYFNITDPRFEVTPDFISQGLARNEDSYFKTTGRELSLLWHAPYYFIRSDIIDAAAKMNYRYIGRDVDSLDWIARRGDSGINQLYHPAADLIERVLEQKKPGSIISMRLGRPDDGMKDSRRDDYLFQKLDLLINQLLARGYEIVPVSEIVDHAQ